MKRFKLRIHPFSLNTISNASGDVAGVRFTGFLRNKGVVDALYDWDGYLASAGIVPSYTYSYQDMYNFYKSYFCDLLSFDIYFNNSDELKDTISKKFSEYNIDLDKLIAVDKNTLGVVKSEEYTEDIDLNKALSEYLMLMFPQVCSNALVEEVKGTPFTLSKITDDYYLLFSSEIAIGYVSKGIHDVILQSDAKEDANGDYEFGGQKDVYILCDGKTRHNSVKVGIDLKIHTKTNALILRNGHLARGTYSHKFSVFDLNMFEWSLKSSERIINICGVKQ